MVLPARPSVYPLALCAALWGCGSDDPVATVAPKVQVVTGHAKAPPGAFEQQAFACCAEPGASAVVRAFSALGATLSADDEAGAQKGAEELATAMSAVPFEGAAAPLEAVGVSIRAASSISEVREAYLEASVPMLAYAKANRGGTDRFAVGYCSMKPGRWLQSEPELANPYYGSEMLRCGVFEAVE